MKGIWKKTSVKVWIIVSSILLALLIAATSVVIKVPFLYGTINSVMGGERRVLKKGDPAEYVYYTSDYETKAEALTAANRINEEINEEGIILLKNTNSVLPLSTPKKVTVFGKNSTNLVLGGSGSSAGTGADPNKATIYSSLKNAGFEYNPVAYNFFDKTGSGRPATPGMGTILTGYPISEVPVSDYTQAFKDSYAEYNGAAIVVISRIGGEGYDLPRTMFWDGSKYNNWSKSDVIPGARSAQDHYLQLDLNETAMLKEAGDNFDNVIVIINSSTSMELGFLDDVNHYAYHPNIKAALWIGNPGETGINALGKVLNGSVNPSGRTVDTYARDFKQDPTWNNFGNNLTGNGNRYTLNGSERNAFFVEYEEGIYVGYRYYETRAVNEGEQWYSNQVVFPLGYGLSYTSFDWAVEEWPLADGAQLNADSELVVKVKVTNTGLRQGKDVVQVYYTAPYTNGGIEKSHVVLGGFAKTKLLAPNESDIVTISFNARDMASYDYNDANNNGFKGFELESGAYTLRVMRNAHTQVDSAVYNLSTDVRYDQDSVTKTNINNLFDDVSSHIKVYLSRSNWSGTWPAAPTVEEREVTQAFISKLNTAVNDQESDPWYSTEIPSQRKSKQSYNRTKVKLYDLVGKSFDDPLWDELLDQLTIGQMKELISKGNFRTMNIDNIAKPLTIDADGPMGFAIFMGDPAVYDTAYYASECVLGATWNIELAYKMGKMIGNEGVMGNLRGDGRPYSGWYAPAVNIHRSQFGGRNFEYYSEDGLLSGKMAAQVIQGAKSKGVYTYLKHFALNDQETNRDTTGLITWANEQAMREIYFAPFEIAVKEGKTTAMMSSFNRMGTVWAGADYNLLTKLLREEWGFRGMVITDFNLKNYMDVDMMIRGGGDLNLSPNKELSKDTSSTSVTSVRRAAKNIMYTVANSNAMNGLGPNVIYKYELPTWCIWLIIADATVFAMCAGWGALVIVKALKSQKKNQVIQDK